MRAPSAALTGWVTTRMLAEASSIASAGKSAGTPPLAPSVWPGGIPGPATRLAGASHLPPAAAQLHVDLTLKERLASLTSRREERDKTFLALRRRYVHELRCFLLERQEQDDALSACAAGVRAARAAPVPGGDAASQPSGAASPGGGASDSQDTPTGGVSRRSSRRAVASSQQDDAVEEDEGGDRGMQGGPPPATPVVASVYSAAGVGEDETLDADPLKMTERAHASAIAAQNVQLRARVSLLTQRLTAEWKDALVAGAVRPPTGPGDEPGQDKALAAAHAAAITAACSPQGETGARGVMHPSSDFYDMEKGLVFASGDIVRCDLGDGLVVGQNDVTGMCCVRLTWGAVVFCPSDQLLLLALAGEDSTTPRRLAHGSAVDKQASLRGGQYGFGGSLLDGAHGEPCDSMHARDEENALAAQLTSQVLPAVDNEEEEEETLAGVPCAGELALLNDVRDSRKPVFRISWDARVPRGVPLRLNPARGLACNGYATGAATRTFDGSGDSGMPGAAYGVSWHPADADVFLADGGRARRGRKESAGPASSSSFALGQHSGGGFNLVPVPEGGLPGHREEGVSTPSQHRSALGELDAQEPPTLAFAAGSAGGVGSAEHEEDASLAHSPMAPHSWGAMSPMTPGGGVSATATKAHMAQSRAEVQRLKYHLRTAEEARKDQRRRLTDSRQSVTYLLGQLSRARAALSAQSEDLTRREGQVAELAGQVERMTHRYSEAVRRAWVVAHPEDAGAASPPSDDSGADDEEDEDEEEEGGMGTDEDAAGSEEEDEGASMDERGADGAAADAMAVLAGAAGAAFGGRKRAREDEEEEEVSAVVAGADDEDAVKQLVTMAAALQGSTLEEDSTPAGNLSDADGGYIAPIAFAPTGPRPGDGVNLSALSAEEFDSEMGAPANDGRTRSLRLRLQGAESADTIPHRLQVLPTNAAVRMYQHKTDKTIMAAIQGLPLPKGAQEGNGEEAQHEDSATGRSQTESVDGGAAGSTSTREEPERRGASRRRRRSAR